MYTLIFITSFLIVLIAMPSIWHTAQTKDLLAHINKRSSHQKPIPNLGGVGIFFSIFLTLLLFSKEFDFKLIIPFLSVGIILFFLGLKDDLMILSSKTKFLGQTLAAIILVELFDCKIENFYGILNIVVIPSYISTIFSIFVILLIVNAYNLIDGIDGLAGTTSLIFLIPISLLYWKLGNLSYLLLALSSIGAIIGFLYFNFSRSKKIFLGDTGSMVIGILMAFFSLTILNNKYNESSLLMNQSPLFLLSLLFFPLYDTFRVIMVRLRLKKNPFEADKNHTHHRYLEHGVNHLRTTLTINLKSLLIILMSWACLYLDSINISLTLIIIGGVLIFEIPHVLFYNSKNRKIMRKSIMLFILFICITSCTSQKDIYYAQEAKNGLPNPEIPQKIEPNDILTIRIMSTDIESAKIYNIDQIEGNQLPQLQPEILKLRGYLVNEQGEISLPVLGKILVVDKSNLELEEYLTKKLISEGHLIKPVVAVRTVNSKVSILGEVRNPGTFTFYEKNLTILQVLGMAGDLTINGSRKDVRLIRQENGMKTIYTIDLTKNDWMENPVYLIKQNDVIVVNPNDAKVKSAGLIGNVGTFVSVTSLLITSILLIRSLN